MIDRLREQIQERLDQLAGEADRLRKALAALDPRSSKRRPASSPRARSPRAAGEASYGGNEAHTGPADEPACDSLLSPDGARGDQGRGTRSARWR